MGSSLIGGDGDIQMSAADGNGANSPGKGMNQNSQNAPIEKKTKNIEIAQDMQQSEQ